MSDHPPPLYSPGDRPELFERPSIFLSASDPYREGWASVRRPARIRSAVVELCRYTFARDWNLIFGGHPAISPLVLSAARHLVAEADHRRRVLVFQSEHFFRDIPPETAELGDWVHGEMLWTAQKLERYEPDRAVPLVRIRPPDAEAPVDGVPGPKEWSLTWMREAMIHSPRLEAAVFVGGMEGIAEEAAIFEELQPGRPLYAIGSTGGAAEQLLASGRCAGTLADTGLLAEDVSYPWVFKTVFEDLDGRLAGRAGAPGREAG